MAEQEYTHGEVTLEVKMSVGFESYLRRNEIKLTSKNIVKHHEDYQKENKRIKALRLYHAI